MANIAERAKKNKKDVTGGSEPGKKMHTAGFYIIVLAAILKDIVDLITGFSIILSVLSFITGTTISFIIGFYLFYNNVSMTTKKIVTLSIMFIIEFIPIISILPSATLSLFLIRYFENNEYAKKSIQSRYT